MSLPARDRPWLLVCGGFFEQGGMDKANLMLAEYLADCDHPVHLVCHKVEERLASHTMIKVHKVPRPLGSWFLGSPVLDWKARRVARQLSRQWPTLRCVANGGNCMLGDVNWAHFVNAAWKPHSAGASLASRTRRSLEHRVECGRERRAYRNARLIIANSEITRKHIEQCLDGIAGARPEIRVIYLGSEAACSQVTPEERSASRHALGIEPNRMVAVFVGGLGFDGRKGFDVLLHAWQILCDDSEWDTDLLVAGGGPALEFWKARVAEAGLGRRIRMLGFRNDIPAVLAAADVLVSTPRYEPYGLNIQEALARGLPVVTSAEAGIAERFPSELDPLLLKDSNNAGELAVCLRVWRSAPRLWSNRCAEFAQVLCARTWRDTAREMVESIESSTPPAGLAGLESVSRMA
jgi:glycosyltransferase involved in cell wall biosynthesis